MPLPRSLTAVLLAVCALVGVGCEDEGGDDGATKPPPVARPSDFPKADGKTLADLRKGLPSGPVLSPATSQFTAGGRNRFSFGLFDRARAQITDAAVAIYVAPSGNGPARGPYLARWEDLDVKPQFQSRSVAADPDAAKSVYVAQLPFRAPGRYEVLGLARLDDRLVVATSAGAAIEVVREDPVPDVGERAPSIHTPTVADVGGDIASIDTRVPPSSMHEVDFADVVGRKPVVLVFATPALCQSRVCGPVVDVAEQVKADRGDDAAWIHMEIYRDNTVEKGFRPQVGQFGLPTEPWVFAIDRRGRVAARIEGAFSARELDEAVDKAVSSGT